MIKGTKVLTSAIVSRGGEIRSIPLVIFSTLRILQVLRNNLTYYLKKKHIKTYHFDNVSNVTIHNSMVLK